MTEGRENRQGSQSSQNFQEEHEDIEVPPQNMHAQHPLLRAVMHLIARLNAQNNNG